MIKLPEQRKRPTGMLGFTFIWIGQLVSVLASNMSGFALTIWAFKMTGSATILGGMQIAFAIPFLLMSPIAGAMVDRYNRKLMMMVSDLGAVLATAGILILNASGQLAIWHMYIASVIYGLSATFQWPAYQAALAVMVPKKQYGRANGMLSLVESGPAVISPILAGALLPFIGLTGILMIDVVTFFLAIGTLLVVFVPPPQRTEEGQAGKGSLLKEGLYGFKYIYERKSLFYLMITILCINFAAGFSSSLITPMILLRTDNNSTTLGVALSAYSIGAVVGGLIVTAWGGFKKRIRGMLLGWIIFGALGLVLFGLGRNLYVWIPALAFAAMTHPFTQSASDSIWQSKVAQDVQGRVFSARRMIAWLTGPFMPLVAGAIADYATEPAMQSDTWLARNFGWMVGNTPGSGMALQYVASGILFIGVVVAAWFIPKVRNVEILLPDHDQLKKAEQHTETVVAVEIN